MPNDGRYDRYSKTREKSSENAIFQMPCCCFYTAKSTPGSEASPALLEAELDAIKFFPPPSYFSGPDFCLLLTLVSPGKQRNSDQHIAPKYGVVSFNNPKPARETVRVPI
jgi:hypothetical protein